MIPKIIWQTYEDRFEDLLPEAKECINTWIDKNPTWQYCYMDAKQREDFVFNNFDLEWHNIFSNCNLKIVKANIWRCMVIYKYGGVYCDLDTICNNPIDNWIKNNYSMTLSRDDDGNPEEFAIHTFAAKPKSKAIELILEKIKNNIKNNLINKKNVVSLSGETVWADIISKNENKYNIYCYPKKSNMFNGIATTHLGTFKKWDKNGYMQWTKE